MSSMGPILSLHSQSCASSPWLKDAFAGTQVQIWPELTGLAWLTFGWDAVEVASWRTR